MPFLEDCVYVRLGWGMATHRDSKVAVAAASSAEGDVEIQVHGRNMAGNGAKGGSFAGPAAPVLHSPEQSPGTLLHHSGDLQAGKQGQHLIDLTPCPDGHFIEGQRLRSYKERQLTLRWGEKGR